MYNPKGFFGFNPAAQLAARPEENEQHQPYASPSPQQHPPSQQVSIMGESKIVSKKELEMREMATRELQQELQQLRLQVQGQGAQPITINNYTSSSAGAVTQRRDGDGDPSSGLAQMLKAIFGSRLNRFFFFSTCGLSLYMLHQYAQHTWRVNEMQRRIDANVLLRMSQWMSQNLDNGR